MITAIIVTIIFNLIAYFTLIARPKLFGVKLFKPMIYNLKLSITPIFILVGVLIVELFLLWVSAVTGQSWIGTISYVFLILGLVAWFLYLPNSGYLITELNLTHREVDEKEVPIWYDIIAVLSLSLSGVLNMVFNIVLLQAIFVCIMDPSNISSLINGWFWFVTGISFFILSFGIYMGRYIRFYSWDLLNPTSFIKKLVNHFKIRTNLVAGIVFTFLYGAFFGLFYMLTFFTPFLDMFKK